MDLKHKYNKSKRVFEVLPDFLIKKYLNLSKDAMV